LPIHPTRCVEIGAAGWNAQSDAEGFAVIRIVDMDVDGVRQVDAKLVQLAQQINTPIVTKLQFEPWPLAEIVQVLNINELSNAVKSIVLPVRI
jgi:uncharacterized protein YacL